jgi:glyoxylase-like metal-dependent hydrolase (beta-lactamase superfamily II)
MKRPWLLLIVCFALIGFAESASTQANQAASRPTVWPPRLAAPAAGEVEVLPVQGKVHVIIGAGSNITVHAGDDGVLMVDTGLASMTPKVLAALKTISTRPLRYIVNTTEFDEYVGGNSAIADTGEIIPFRAPDYTAGPQGALDITRASVISYYTLLHRVAGPGGKAPRIPEDGWPDNTYSIPQKRLYFNDEPVIITHIPSNTDSNSVVLFRKSDVVSAGGLLDLTTYPVIDVAGGGSIQAIVDGLNRLIDITVPASHAGGGTLVVPGHGRIADHAEVVYYRDMNTIIRDRVEDMVKKGMTLAQVKAARPSRDYDARYGKQTGPWTTDMFVEAVYQSLKK